MVWRLDRHQLLEKANGSSRYEQIAGAIESAIDQGQLRPGERLPTVRALASQVGVSGASVAVAYGVLARRGRVHAQVGRGTFVSPPPDPANRIEARSADAAPREPPPRAGGISNTLLAASWRRRVLRVSDRLRAVNPEALVCTVSGPDPELLPIQVLKRAFKKAVEKMQPAELQYSGPEAHPDLVRALLPHLERDGISAVSSDLIVMSSMHQLLALSLPIAAAVLETRELIVAVEEPGHHGMFDTIESRGHRLIGVQVDTQGAIPASLDDALERGAHVALLTQRGLNPTGASWTPERRAALADVLAGHPHAIIIEDDYWGGIADTSPGSLFGDPRTRERTIYCRSFAKSIAPDLRMAVVAAAPRLRTLLRDAKLVTDGWSPRLSQRALALSLEDPALETAFAAARAAYAERRDAAIEAITARLTFAFVAPAADGVNVWVELPPGCDALDVIHNAVELGVLVSSGEAFYIRPGHNNAVRVSIGWVGREGARRAGELLASAALTVDAVPISIVI